MGNARQQPARSASVKRPRQPLALFLSQNHPDINPNHQDAPSRSHWLNRNWKVNRLLYPLQAPLFPPHHRRRCVSPESGRARHGRLRENCRAFQRHHSRPLARTLLAFRPISRFQQRQAIKSASAGETRVWGFGGGQEGSRGLEWHHTPGCADGDVQTVAVLLFERLLGCGA